jgi:molybdopterin/thiamine biosynthesis adenylyltransferase
MVDMKKITAKLLGRYTRERSRADGSVYSALLHADEMQLTKEADLSAREVQIAALQHNIIPERYCRNQKTLSNEDQIKLLQTHVAVIGQGGLGGTVTEILARIGIGMLTLVDGDVFEDSNLNRQILSTTANLGQKKAEVAKERVNLLNPAVDVRVITDFFTRENGEDILRNTDLAVDCLDSIPDRFVVEDACRQRQIPLISAAIAGTYGQSMVIFPGDVGLCRIYGKADAAPPKGIETQRGTLPFTAIYMAAVECAEIVSIVCTASSQLRNSLLITDITSHHLEKINFT